MNNPVVTLTTDFGYEDPFAGIMKGIILKINPQASIVDLTHGIKPHDIREAAFSIGMSYEFFPSSTVHIVVVDPGVGSSRRPIITVTEHHYFVGPDNGVFSQVYNMGHEMLQVIHVTSGHYFLSSESSTFHGRDIFAPIAAYLTRGIHVSKFGEPITDYHTIPLPSPSYMPNENRLQGEVILIDRFGNAITNIKTSDVNKLLSAKPGSALKILLHGKEVPHKKFYSQVKDRGIYSLINSSGYLEVFTYRGNASSEHNISIGDIVEIKLTEKPA